MTDGTFLESQHYPLLSWGRIQDSGQPRIDNEALPRKQAQEKLKGAAKAFMWKNRLLVLPSPTCHWFLEVLQVSYCLTFGFHRTVLEENDKLHLSQFTYPDSGKKNTVAECTNNTISTQQWLALCRHSPTLLHVTDTTFWVIINPIFTDKESKTRSQSNLSTAG